MGWVLDVVRGILASIKGGDVEKVVGIPSTFATKKGVDLLGWSHI